MKKLLLNLLPNFLKPRIKGTWEEIVKTVFDQFSKHPKLKMTDGFLIRFVGVKKHYTPYIFTKKNIKKLLLRKRDNCFMIPGDCGQISLDDSWNYIFELIEIPENTWGVNIKDVMARYRIKKASKKQHEYY